MKQSRSRRRVAFLSVVTSMLVATAPLFFGAGSAMAAGWLGISVQDITRDVAEAMNLRAAGGALISDVVTGSPAEVAGLRQGDVITRVDSEAVSTSGDLVSYLSRKASGDVVTVHVLREGGPRTFEIRLGTAPPPSPGGSAPGEISGNDREGTEQGRGGAIPLPAPAQPRIGWRLGLRVTPINRDLAPYFRAEAGRGVLVIGVVPGSAGEEAGIRSGDVILKVDGIEISTPAELRDQIARLKEGDTFAMDVLRQGRITRIEGTARGGMAMRTPGDIRRPRQSTSPDYRWNPEQEMIWGHNQLQKLEREMQELRKRIEALSQRIEKLRQDRSP